MKKQTKFPKNGLLLQKMALNNIMYKKVLFIECTLYITFIKFTKYIRKVTFYAKISFGTKQITFSSKNLVLTSLAKQPNADIRFLY